MKSRGYPSPKRSRHFLLQVATVAIWTIPFAFNRNDTTIWPVNRRQHAKKNRRRPKTSLVLRNAQRPSIYYHGRGPRLLGHFAESRVLFLGHLCAAGTTWWAS
jgi:hypothetical protein